MHTSAPSNSLRPASRAQHTRNLCLTTITLQLWAAEPSADAAAMSSGTPSWWDNPLAEEPELTEGLAGGCASSVVVRGDTDRCAPADQRRLTLDAWLPATGCPLPGRSSIKSGASMLEDAAGAGARVSGVAEQRPQTQVPAASRLSVPSVLPDASFGDWRAAQGTKQQAAEGVCVVGGSSPLAGARPSVPSARTLSARRSRQSCSLMLPHRLESCRAQPAGLGAAKGRRCHHTERPG